MNKFESNKAFQEFLKNAPEMPDNQNPKNNKSSSNFGLVMTIVCSAVGQLLLFVAMRKMMQERTFLPPPPKKTDSPSQDADKK